jgi:5-(carboxyamino)imidazole ribonucleotide synthase
VNPTTIESGSILGVLGGGQLGAMFAESAIRSGYRVAVWDPDSEAPAHRLATHSFAIPFNDQQAFTQFANLVSAVTYEWENVPVQLCQQLEQRKPVRPSSRILGLIQNRILQKSYLAERGFPVPTFATLTDPGQLHQIIQRLGCPALCKTATSGYDGKGQWKIGELSEVSEIASSLRASMRPGMEWIVEAFVPFDRELSILVARGVGGQTVVYPLVENEHEEGILRMTIVPAVASRQVMEEATNLARAFVEGMDGIGVFCLELFLVGEQILINEIAPRPHNSGHYTLDACSLSQFEQQVRTVCGHLPAEPRLLSPAAMVNLIGRDAETITTDADCRTLLSLSGSHLHLYGKRTVRPRRKMGHVTFLAEERRTAQDRAAQFRRSLRLGQRA